MTLPLPHNHLVAASDLYTRHVAIRELAYHPTGEHIPVAEAELTLTPLHRWMRMVELFVSNPALEEQGRATAAAADSDGLCPTVDEAMKGLSCGSCPLRR